MTWYWAFVASKRLLFFLRRSCFEGTLIVGVVLGQIVVYASNILHRGFGKVVPRCIVHAENRNNGHLGEFKAVLGHFWSWSTVLSFSTKVTCFLCCVYTSALFVYAYKHWWKLNFRFYVCWNFIPMLSLCTQNEGWFMYTCMACLTFNVTGS